MSTAGDYSGLSARDKTDLNNGGAIYPDLYRVYINELPRRIRMKATADNLNPIRWVKRVADDVVLAAKLAAAMQAHLNKCS